MEWKGRRSSDNVEDARGTQVVAGGAIGILLTRIVTRLWGFKGLAVIAGVGLLGYMTGIIDPAFFLGGSQVKQTEYQPTAEEQEVFNFVTVVLADTEDVWRQQFQAIGREYIPPTLVIFSGQYPTECGMGDARMGPFYCPADQQVYIDLGFYDALEQEFQAPGDFAQAYVIAHEIGHHVQRLLGITDQVHAAQKRTGKAEANELSVRLELQADFLAGVWAYHAQRARQVLEEGDIEEALNAASRIGDDRLQMEAQGYVVPDAFTHGTSEQRMRWFLRGYQTGDLSQGDTFKASSL